MKKIYVKASIDDSVLYAMKEDMEDYVDDYYGYLDPDAVPKPYCSITEDGTTKDGNPIYKFSIEFATLYDEDVDDICEELTDRAYGGSGYVPYKDFTWDGDFTFTGYITKTY